MTYDNIESLRTEDLKISPLNPREGPTDLEELRDSISRNGIQDPLIVRKIQKGENKGEREVLVGSRRLMAAEGLGIEEVPCIIVKEKDEEAVKRALISNVVSKDLEPVEVANTVKYMLKRFSYKYQTLSDVASELGKTTTWLSEQMKVLDVPEMVRDKVTTKENAEKGDGINLEQAIAIEEEAKSPSGWRTWTDKAGREDLSASEIKARMEKERKETGDDTSSEQRTLTRPIYRTKKPDEFFDVIENGEILLDESVVKGQEINVNSKVKFEVKDVKHSVEEGKWKVSLE